MPTSLNNIPEAPALPSFLVNSTKPTIITTQFPSKPKESPSPPPPITNGSISKQHNIIERKPSSFKEQVHETSIVRLGANIEVGRLEMKDIAERELNHLCEYYYQDILEEVIQSDFEKPSIPEVILAVITDITDDDQVPNVQNPIYYLNQHSNEDIENYYKHIHQTATHPNGQDSARSTTSSDKSITLVPIIDRTSNDLQVKFRELNRKF